jgi:hypothetical protein
MKKLIAKIIGGSVLSATFAVVFISCSKEQQAVDSNSSKTQFATELRELNEAAVLNCAGTIPDSLQVPEGNKLAYQAYATGVQIYEVRRSATDPNVFVWVNIAPSAILYIRPDYTNQVGIHYGGPSWEFTKGPYKNEKTVAAKLKGTTINATAVPWLLLKAVDAQSSAGNQVTYIQRVCTTGGLAPTTIPSESNLGQQQSIPYTATYLFYETK